MSENLEDSKPAGDRRSTESESELERGVRIERGIKVNVSQEVGDGVSYHMTVSHQHSDMAIMMVDVTPDVVRELRGDGPIMTCAAIFGMMEDALRDFGFDGADDFTESESRSNSTDEQGKSDFIGHMGGDA